MNKQIGSCIIFASVCGPAIFVGWNGAGVNGLSAAQAEAPPKHSGGQKWAKSHQYHGIPPKMHQIEDLWRKLPELPSVMGRPASPGGGVDKLVTLLKEKCSTEELARWRSPARQCQPPMEIETASRNSCFKDAGADLYRQGGP